MKLSSKGNCLAHPSTLNLSLLLSSVLIGFPGSVAISQTGPCANYWTNPQTGQLECLTSSGTRTGASSATSTGLNQKIYHYALNRLGQQVGDGECSTLVYQALKSARAKNFDQMGPTGPDADYVWGSRVTTLTPASRSAKGVQVGDIIQFRNVSTYKKETYSDGSWRFWTSQYSHHTAIVAGVSGQEVLLLHQNIGSDARTRKTVQWGSLNLEELKTGTLWVYRPTY